MHHRPRRLPPSLGVRIRAGRALFSALTLVAGVLFGVAVAEAPAHALNNGLALTPPMGWNDWNAGRVVDGVPRRAP